MEKHGTKRFGCDVCEESAYLADVDEEVFVRISAHVEGDHQGGNTNIHRCVHQEAEGR